jgi:hypothetical protein
MDEVEDCLVGDEDEPPSSAMNGYIFWGYGLMLPDLLRNAGRYRYSLIRHGWQHLDKDFQWSEV